MSSTSILILVSSVLVIAPLAFWRWQQKRRANEAIGNVMRRVKHVKREVMTHHGFEAQGGITRVSEMVKHDPHNKIGRE